MSYADRNPEGGLLTRLRDRLGQRVSGLVIALLLEAVLLLLLLTMSQSKGGSANEDQLVATFDANSEPEAAAEPEPESKPDPSASPTPQPQAEPEPTPPLPQEAPPPPLIPRPSTRNFDLSQVPKAPAQPQPQRQRNYGPAAPANLPRDSERVGTMPNGEPLYRAEWYREPSDQMLGDYLSTSQGPGWGMIACRTEPQWKVVDCVPLEERPANSQIARAVLAAAWEFQVRPPRLGGKYQYGEWVRIRIDYNLRRDTGFKPKD